MKYTYCPHKVRLLSTKSTPIDHIKDIDHHNHHFMITMVMMNTGLTRSLGLEKLPINNKTLRFYFFR